MADEGFKLHEGCTASNLSFSFTSVTSGASQMTSSEVSKTSSITKVRILVEQVIRRILGN